MTNLFSYLTFLRICDVISQADNNKQVGILMETDSNENQITWYPNKDEAKDEIYNLIDSKYYSLSVYQK
jgi:hypothetical protein